MSVFALYARPEGNWLSVAAVVQLMGDLGTDDQAVRSSISRLKRRGVLLSEKRDGVAGYVLSPTTLDVLADGDVRIFERIRADVADGWLLVVFSVPESEREKRHALRATLTRLGFGTAAPGVWVAPGTLVSETRHALERQRLAGYAQLFAGTYVGGRDARADVRQWWNLDDLDALYSDFLRRFRPVRTASRSAPPTPVEAFQAYVPMLTQWRRLPYRDPGLPLSLLPANWPGETAWELFDELNGALRPLARKHAVSVINSVPLRRTRST